MGSTSGSGKSVFGIFVFGLIVAQVADDDEHDQQRHAESQWQFNADGRSDDQRQRNSVLKAATLANSANRAIL